MPEGDVYVNPQTGERVVLRGGQWVPDTGGQGVPPPGPPGIRYGTPPPKPQPQAAPAGLADALRPGGPGILGPNGTFTAPAAAPQMSEADRLKEAQRLAKEAASAESLNTEIGTTRGKANEALNLMDRNDFRFQVGVPGTGDAGNIHGGWDNSLLGFAGQMGRTIPGSDASVFDGMLDTIRSNLAIKKLLEMKANSQTGASGFGSLSGPELNLLQSNITSLDLHRNNPESMRRGLNEINRLLAKAYPDSVPTTARATARPRPGTAGRTVPRGLGANISIGQQAPARPRGVPADAHWDARARQWVK